MYKDISSTRKARNKSNKQKNCLAYHLKPKLMPEDLQIILSNMSDKLFKFHSVATKFRQGEVAGFVSASSTVHVRMQE